MKKERKDPKDIRQRMVVVKLKQARTWEISTRYRLNNRCESYNYKADNSATEYDLNNDETFDRQSYPLAELLFKIHGVQRLEIDQYDVRITYGKAFDSSEVISQVVNTIQIYVRRLPGNVYGKN